MDGGNSGSPARAETLPFSPAFSPPLLDVLLRAQGHTSVEELHHRLGSPSPADLRAQIGRLVAAGCDIEHHPQRGVRLVRAGLATWADYLPWACPLRAPGQRVVEVYRRTASTQDAARRIAETSSSTAAADGAVAVADEQSAGRGRLGRRWLAPAGMVVTFSLVHLAAGPQGLAVDRLMLATAVAVAQAIETVARDHAIEARIKWPNDVLVCGRKIAGVLVEISAPPGRGPAAIIGVGINVALRPEQVSSGEPGLRQRVTSLAMLGVEVDRLLVLAEAIRRMDAALRGAAIETLVGQWQARSVLAGQRVSLRSDGRDYAGHVVDLDPTGALILRTDSGELVHLPAATATLL